MHYAMPVTLAKIVLLLQNVISDSALSSFD